MPLRLFVDVSRPGPMRRSGSTWMSNLSPSQLPAGKGQVDRRRWWVGVEEDNKRRREGTLRSQQHGKGSGSFRCAQREADAMVWFDIVWLLAAYDCFHVKHDLDFGPAYYQHITLLNLPGYNLISRALLAKYPMTSFSGSTMKPKPKVICRSDLPLATHIYSPTTSASFLWTTTGSRCSMIPYTTGRNGLKPGYFSLHPMWAFKIGYSRLVNIKKQYLFG